MNLADVNVLVEAMRDHGPRAAPCRRWFEQELNSGRRFAVAPLAFAATVRIMTNPRAFQPPSNLDGAFAFARSDYDHPLCKVVEAGPSHWRIFERLCRAANATGNLVTDAWYAALAIEHNCTFVTLDRDFARFPGLKTSSPLIGS